MLRKLIYVCVYLKIIWNEMSKHCVYFQPQYIHNVLYKHKTEIISHLRRTLISLDTFHCWLLAILFECVFIRDFIIRIYIFLLDARCGFVFYINFYTIRNTCKYCVFEKKKFKHQKIKNWRLSIRFSTINCVKTFQIEASQIYSFAVNHLWQSLALISF